MFPLKLTHSISVLLVLVIFLFASCEKDTITDVIKNEVVQEQSYSLFSKQNTSIEYHQLTNQQQADFARLLGWLWGDGKPTSNGSGTKFTGFHPKYNQVFNRLKNLTVNGNSNPFNLPLSGDNKKLSDFYDYWDNALPGGNSSDPDILRDALKNPNFLAGLIDGEGFKNHAPGSVYYIDDQTYAPSHPKKTNYGMITFGPNRMIQLFQLLGETYGMTNTVMQIGRDNYSYTQRCEAITALISRYNLAKATNENPNLGTDAFTVRIIIDNTDFSVLRSYGYWNQNGYRSPAPDDATLNKLTGNYPDMLTEVTGTMSFFYDNQQYIRIRHTNTNTFLSSNIILSSSGTSNSALWSKLDVDGEHFRIVSNDNKWLKGFSDGSVNMASTQNTGWQTQWKTRELSNGRFLITNRLFPDKHLRVNNDTNVRIGSKGSKAHWSFESPCLN